MSAAKHASWVLPFAAALFLSTSATAQELLRTVDGPSDPFVVWLSQVSHYADINGDGIEEFLVGGSGGNGGYVAVIDGATNQAIFSYLFSGWVISHAGDFNGDGVLDFMAGYPIYTPPPFSQEFLGQYQVWSGATGELLASGLGSFELQEFGLSVAGVGDTNGNGYSEVLVAGFSGPVYLFGGPSGQLIRWHVGPHTRHAVAGLGDVNGDGHADYIIGWPQDSTNGTWTGRATVYSGLDGSELYSVYGDIPQQFGQTGDHLGRSVAAMGDVDGDGVPDFAVGLPAEVDLLYHASRTGKVRVYSGADGSLLYELDGSRWVELPTRKLQFGHTIASGRDIDGDGIQDLLVIVPRYPEANQRSVLVFSGADGTLLWQLAGYHAIGFVGDLNGDGLAEFGTGHGSFGTGRGRVWIWAGAAGGLERHCAAAPSSTGAPARLEARGPISVGNANLALELEAAPPGQSAVLFYGAAQAPAPFGNGSLCVAPGPPGIFRLGPIATTDPQGEATWQIDWTSPPATSPTSALAPGSTWTFQVWYRDPPAPPAGTNLSDALSITFVP